MRRHLILDKMERRKWTRNDVAEHSEGLLSYDMVEKHLNKKNVELKASQIKGYITAFDLTDAEIRTIFFEDAVQ